MIQKLAVKFLLEMFVEKLSGVLLGEKVPLDMLRASTMEVLIPANRKITKTLLRKVALAMLLNDFEIAPSPVRNVMHRYYEDFQIQYIQAAAGYLANARVSFEDCARK